MRDQLYTELMHRFDNLLYKAGVEVFGRRKVDDHIPAPNSRVVTRTAAVGESSPPPAPVTPPGGG